MVREHRDSPLGQNKRADDAKRPFSEQMSALSSTRAVVVLLEEAMKHTMLSIRIDRNRGLLLGLHAASLRRSRATVVEACRSQADGDPPLIHVGAFVLTVALSSRSLQLTWASIAGVPILLVPLQNKRPKSLLMRHLWSATFR
jgi:hypothetical protein